MYMVLVFLKLWLYGHKAEMLFDIYCYTTVLLVLLHHIIYSFLANEKLSVFASLSRFIAGQRVPAQNGIWVWRLCNICRLQTLYQQKMTSASLSQYFTSCSQHHHDYHLISL